MKPDELLAANPQYSGNPDRMQIGDVLQIPGCQKTEPTGNAQAPAPTNPPGVQQVYAVVAGDNLVAIARRFNVTVQDIKTANNLTSDFLSIGQKLVIPAK